MPGAGSVAAARPGLLMGIGGTDGQNRPDRGGQRAQYEALSRSVGGAWLSDVRHQQRFRGARSRAQAPSRSDPDGYPAAPGVRARGDALDQGRSGAAFDSGGRGHRVCDEGRRGTHPRGRLRGVFVQTNFGRQVYRNRSTVYRVGESSMSARILVVDDVPANVKLLEARLSAEYFDVLTASNGTEALAICARAECDIILLDVMMPDMDGFEVCRRLKSNPVTHFIPVVMITALDSPADRVRGLEAGACTPISSEVM